MFVIHRIISTVGIKIQPISTFNIKISSIIRRNKSAPFGIIVSCIKIIKPGIFVEIVTSVTNGVVSLKVGVGCGTAYSIAVCIVLIFYNSIPRVVKYAYYVTLRGEKRLFFRGSAYPLWQNNVAVIFGKTEKDRIRFSLYRNNEAVSNAKFETASFNRGSGVSHEII